MAEVQAAETEAIDRAVASMDIDFEANLSGAIGEDEDLTFDFDE